jgi:RHS repeat-associated protein
VPVTVTVSGENGDPYPDLDVYAFDGETYTGFHGVSDENGQVVFTLPEGDYRFRADYDGVPFWSNTSDHCAVPGCKEAGVAIPGGLGHEEVTIDYTYDPLNRLTAADYSDETFFHYQYDAVGNRLQLDSSQDGVVTYQYDAANRLIEAGGVAYTWDANGNLLSDGTSTYTYNYANMLASVDQEEVVYEYLYSGLGERLQQTINGVSTNYTLDINTGLTQVLADDTHIYLYGQGRIAQEETEVEYFLGDALSSVRQLTDSSTVVTLTQHYEPYGSVLISDGNGESVFQFTGEMQNNITNLVYLRSRYLSPNVGRFIARDSWDGNYLNPLSLNKWIYVEDSPINLTDPSGRTPYWWCDDKNNPDACKEVSKLSRQIYSTSNRTVRESTVEIFGIWSEINICVVDYPIKRKITDTIGHSTKGLGSLVKHQGVFRIYTHNHFEYLHKIDKVEFRNTKGELITIIDADDFRIRMSLAQDSGNAVIVAPPELLPGSMSNKQNLTMIPRYGSFGDPENIEEFFILKVPRWSGTNIMVMEALVEKTEQNRWGVPDFNMESLSLPIMPGDSGGGLWFDEKVVGNTWTTTLEGDKYLLGFKSAKLPSRFHSN